MKPVTIIAGCPGSGKTTLARRVALRSNHGVHVVTDDFYHFLAHPLDPSTPESNAQNTAVIRAFLQAARSFNEDGYDVCIDGVIGPWWFTTIRAVFPAFDYVILHADLSTVLRRTSDRALIEQSSADPDLVATMHAQFDRLEGYERRTIDTADLSVEVLLDEFLRRQARGDFKS